MMENYRIKTKQEIEHDRIVDDLRAKTAIDEKESLNLTRSYMIALRNLPEPQIAPFDIYSVCIKNSYFGYVMFRFNRRPYMIEIVTSCRKIIEMKRAKCHFWELEEIEIRTNSDGVSSVVSSQLPDEIEYMRTMDGFESVKRDMKEEKNN